MLGSPANEVGALRNSLRNALCSARPLIPGVERCWWGARMRPRPPYVRKEGEGRRGRIRSPQEVVVEGSADGRKGEQHKPGRGSERNLGRATARRQAKVGGEKR